MPGTLPSPCALRARLSSAPASRPPPVAPAFEQSGLCAALAPIHHRLMCATQRACQPHPGRSCYFARHVQSHALPPALWLIHAPVAPFIHPSPAPAPALAVSSPCQLHPNPSLSISRQRPPSPSISSRHRPLIAAIAAVALPPRRPCTAPCKRKIISSFSSSQIPDAPDGPPRRERVTDSLSLGH